MREVVCTKRVCDALLSLLFSLVDFGVLADKNRRISRMMQRNDEDAASSGKSEEDGATPDAAPAAAGEKAAEEGEEKGGLRQRGRGDDFLSVHNTFMDVVIR